MKTHTFEPQISWFWILPDNEYCFCSISFTYFKWLLKLKLVLKSIQQDDDKYDDKSDEEVKEAHGPGIKKRENSSSRQRFSAAATIAVMAGKSTILCISFII